MGRSSSSGGGVWWKARRTSRRSRSRPGRTPRSGSATSRPSSWPAGVTIEPFYDRSDLIARAIDTLKHSLWESVLLVTLVHILFLFHFRSILIVTLPLPASILIAFILMRQFGIESHIMSLTGIAI